jgi:hypothetical protein
MSQDGYLSDETIYQEGDMSLQAQASYTVPEETARVARAIFPHGHPYLQLYETFGKLFQDQVFAQQYAKRAGIEGTLSQGVRCFDLRRARYIGLAKTHLQHILIAGAMNLMRVAHWLAEEPLAQVHPSAFVRLHWAAVA